MKRLAAVLLLCVPGAILACSLNPQPLPPGETHDDADVPQSGSGDGGPTGSLSGSSGGSDNSGSGSSSSGGGAQSDGGLAGGDASGFDGAPDGSGPPGDGGARDASGDGNERGDAPDDAREHKDARGD